ncbi:hypothetical protein HG530_008326 [Fusarium avenaceum]|nr:hypothetical protein HG530_008326 [Fusarium avenaceum]
MLRRPATTLHITSEDVAAYEDRRAREALVAAQQARRAAAVAAAQQSQADMEGVHQALQERERDDDIRRVREDRIAIKRLRFQVTQDVLRSVSSPTPLFMQYPQAILLKIKTPSNGRFIYPLHASYRRDGYAVHLQTPSPSACRYVLLAEPAIELMPGQEMCSLRCAALRWIGVKARGRKGDTHSHAHTLDGDFTHVLLGIRMHHLAVVVIITRKDMLDVTYALHQPDRVLFVENILETLAPSGPWEASRAANALVEVRKVFQGLDITGHE